MRGLHLWRAAGSGAPCALAPGLTACAHLLERATAAAAAAAPAASSSSAAATSDVSTVAAAAGTTAAQPPAYAAAVADGSSRSCAAGAPNSSSSTSSSGSTSYSRSAAGALIAAGSSGGTQSGSGSGANGGSGGGSGRQGRRWRWGRWSAGGGGGGAGAGSASGSSSYSFGSGFGAVAAGAAASGFAASVLTSAALADSGPNQEALAAAQRALTAAWAEVEEEFARLNSRLPAHAPSLKGESPTVSEVHGAVEVVVPIREGADSNAVLRELRQGLGGQGSTSYSESVYGASRTVRMEIRQPGGGTLRVMMFVPPPGGSEQAQVVVSKRGAFSVEELASLSRLVAAANVTFGLEQPPRSSAARRHGLHGSSSTTDAEAHGRVMDEMFEALARSALAGIVAGPMQQILSELQRGIQGLEDEDEDEEGEGGGFGGFGGPSGGSFPGPPAPPSAQPHRPKGHVEPGGRSSTQGHDWGSPAAARAVDQLLAMGAQVFPPGSKDQMDWGVLAGYEDQKRTIEDCLLLPLLRPDVYAKLARATRKTPANNCPRAVLFEGPPGTGKTTSARVISSQAAVPLIYLPLEAVLSKWYGQSEQQLGAVFKAAEAMGGAIIFLDELDALGGNREGGLHEVSRRLLSVLLREMEGFDADTKRTVVIGATNRKTDLDPALLSRFDLVITFGLPDASCRQLILRQYAQQLSEVEVAQLAERTGGMSGRDLRDVCEHTERRWASKIIRGEVSEEELPPLAEYLASADERATAVQHVQHQSAATAALNRLLSGVSAGGGGSGGGGGKSSSLPSWLGGGQQ